MSKHLWLFLILISFSSCKKLTQFNIDYTTEVIISSSINQSLPFSIYTPDITSNSEYEFEVNDTRKDKINSIYLEDLTLTITSPSTQNFDFLKNVEVFISSANNPEFRIAFKLNHTNTGETQLICDLEHVDLQAYIKESSFSIRLETTTDELLSSDVTIDVYTNFFVDAQLIK